ncbi:MAG: ATP-binding cassette domain-containing protein [Methanocellales archaeon]
MDGYAIETFDLTKRFGSILAVDKLNLKIKYGEIFGLLGPNGAGKTTTISMLCTIINPTSGTAKVNGYDIIKEQDKVRKSIGIVFQDPSIDDRLTGRENLEFHAMLYGVPKEVRDKRIKEVLKLVELEDRANSQVRTYSGGMRRRLEIARGLLHYPKVLFLDEPTLGLDPQTREHIWKYIEELAKRENITIVLTTHYMEEAEKLCNRVAIIDYGVIKALDTPDNLKNALEGDIVKIKTSNPKLLAAKLIEKALILKSNESSGLLNVTVKNGEMLIPKIVEVASESGVSIESIALQKPTLNDVFLHYTGREIRVAEAEQYLPPMIAARRRRLR